MWNFKGPRWNSTQNTIRIQWKIWFLYNIEIWRALRFKSSYRFETPPVDPALLLWQPGFCSGSAEEDLHTVPSGLVCTLWLGCPKSGNYAVHPFHEWKYFLRYWPFVWRIHRSPVNSPHKGQWCGALMFSLICAWINGWVNNRTAGDLRHHRAHYGVTVMPSLALLLLLANKPASGL